MLVLSRKKNEKVLLTVPGTDQEIEVVVVRVDANRVRLGFAAPDNVSILRGELKGITTVP